MPALWLEPDGTLRDFDNSPYWVLEDFLQWSRGEHHAHCDRYHCERALVAFREYHAERAFRQQELQEVAASLEEIKMILPPALRETEIQKNHNKAVKPRRFLAELRREYAQL
jgi:hypothetical protein